MSTQSLSTEAVIGLDLGTSGVKAVLLTAAGELVAEAGAPLEVSRPQPLWSEQAPADWWQAIDAALLRLRESAGPHWSQVRALAVAGQMHGAVLLDAAGGVLRPAILWNDGRSQAECDELEAREPATRRITANRAMAGFTAPKLLWVAKHEPDVFARTAKVLLPKDWLVWRLCGQMSTDTSDAAGTLWLDVARRQWSEAMLAACGMRVQQMPALHEGPEPVGTLRDEWASRWELPRGVQVAAGAGDNAAGAIGVGVVRPGQALLSLGTSGVIFTPVAEPLAAPERGVHTFCHALPGVWHQMAVMLNAASALAWWSRITGAEPASLLAELPDAPAREAAPLFLPYLSGERTPHADPGATATFLGLTAAHDRPAMSYAVIEGVAHVFADGLAALQAAGSRPERLLAIGGGARSPAWLQLIADTLQLPVDQPAGAEMGPALGAARLALLALGHPFEAVVQPPRIACSYMPDAQRVPACQRRLQRFRAAWAPLRALS